MPEPNLSVVCDREMIDGRLRNRLDDKDAGHGRSLPAVGVGLELRLTIGVNRVQCTDRECLGARAEDAHPNMIRRHLMTLRVGLMLADYILAVAVFWLLRR